MDDIIKFITSLKCSLIKKLTSSHKSWMDICFAFNRRNNIIYRKYLFWKKLYIGMLDYTRCVVTPRMPRQVTKISNATHLFFLTEKYTVDIYESSNNIEIILTSINKQEAELNLDQMLYQFVIILKFVLK